MSLNDRRTQCTPQDNFRNGITNGAQWYDVPGGMQDYNYVHSNDFEITIELTCCKYPEANKLVSEWRNNKESLLKYMELVHSGVKGLVIDSVNKKPIRNAKVKIFVIDTIYLPPLYSQIILHNFISCFLYRRYLFVA